jgi:hypothetical protein
MSNARNRPQLHDQVDQERDGIFLVTHGMDRDQLVSRMGGSPR